MVAARPLRNSGREATLAQPRISVQTPPNQHGADAGNESAAPTTWRMQRLHAARPTAAPGRELARAVRGRYAA